MSIEIPERFLFPLCKRNHPLAISNRITGCAYIYVPAEVFTFYQTDSHTSSRELLEVVTGGHIGPPGGPPGSVSHHLESAKLSPTPGGCSARDTGKWFLPEERRYTPSNGVRISL